MPQPRLTAFFSRTGRGAGARRDHQATPGFGRRLLAALLALWLAALPAPGLQRSALAQSGGITILSDAEIESTLRTMATPILQAAGLNPPDVRIVLIQDDEWNAFVAGGQNIFVNSGLIIGTEDVTQLLGVIAHETGHISGGHLVRGSEAMSGAGLTAMLATILGAAVMIGAGSGDAGAGIMAGGQELAKRSIYAFTRTQESSADQAAYSFLERAGISPRGMASFFRKMEARSLMPSDRANEYIRTHPLTIDRIEAGEAAVMRSKFKDATVAPEIEEIYNRMKAKLAGYLQPQLALQDYKPNDNSFSAHYARAIAHYKLGNAQRGIRELNQLIAVEPNNPYLYEMRGQIQFEDGQVAAAAASYRQAKQLAPQAYLIRLSAAHPLIEMGDEASLREAVEDLRTVLRIDPDLTIVHLRLSIAYGRLGDMPMAKLHQAEYALAGEKFREAEFFARQALTGLPPGSPAARQADDILLHTRDTDGKMRRSERETRSRSRRMETADPHQHGWVDLHDGHQPKALQDLERRYRTLMGTP